MIKGGKGGANTTTGAIFEERTVGKNTNGIAVHKHDLYHLLEKRKINYLDYISKKLLPDECYLDEANDELRIYEKKTQNTGGSVDEKIQTCGFKISQFKKIAKALNIHNVTYTYILDNWFKDKKYKDALDYINSIPGCSYYFSDNVDKE